MRAVAELVLAVKKYATKQTIDELSVSIGSTIVGGWHDQILPVLLDASVFDRTYCNARLTGAL